MGNDQESKTSFTSGAKDNDSVIERYATTPEARTDDQNEALAYRTMEKLNASDPRPYLAVAYSGIPSSVIDRHMATARELGRVPAALFMHLIKREPLWRAYKQKKDTQGPKND